MLVSFGEVDEGKIPGDECRTDDVRELRRRIVVKP
jgi:hypothetical protein